jgi:hypothetical protein
MPAMFGLFGAVRWMFRSVIGLLVLAFCLWMLIHAVTNKKLGDGEKIAWVLVILFVPVLGALIYFFVAKDREGAGLG